MIENLETKDTGTRFTQVEFSRFKAFKKFKLSLRQFNILVGPNNAGKSTILIGFRILAAAMRRAGRRKSEPIRGPEGMVHGYPVDLTAISIAEENIFFNYDDASPATVRFKLSNGNELLLYFPEQGSCFLIADANGRTMHTPSTFKSRFNCAVGFVPILGPLEHNEAYVKEDTARISLFNYRASRNFRNIWYHFPEKFDEFRDYLKRTWPGMDVERPIAETTPEGTRLYMFCPEDRIPREIFWAGFGFQVWCQMLTHIIQRTNTALFLIDEPDIYLHSDLQRQLLGLLRDMGPDIILATHSTEIIAEAEPDDIVLVDKRRSSAKRIKRPAELGDVFSALGSNLNPTLTQLAKTRKVVFVEGQDFQIISKFAIKLGHSGVGNRSSFAVVPVGGFNPERMRNLLLGMRLTLGSKIVAAAILDRDYRSGKECQWILAECEKFCELVTIHGCKEIENFLLVPDPIDRASRRRVADRATRSGKPSTAPFEPFARGVLEVFSSDSKIEIQGQYLSARRKFERGGGSPMDESTFNQEVLREFEAIWAAEASRRAVVPGKEALATINRALQDKHGVNVTPTSIIESMKSDEVPEEMVSLLLKLSSFADSVIPEG
ncbi:ATP-dependent nuclease [Rhodopseudomonas sp. NSM]|uniref:ATP-dependent nuclease n=1 Tax=Rhodopseudomonas sp. NSM TaxID=3457630 RepID=UPI004034F898